MQTLTITTIQDEKDLSLLLDFMKKQPQYYPNYKDWLFGKCKERIESGRYIPIITISKGKVIGEVLFQYLDKENIEIKKASMNLDVSIDNFQGIEFFIQNGFKILKKENLYLPLQFEYVMKRD